MDGKLHYFRVGWEDVSKDDAAFGVVGVAIRLGMGSSVSVEVTHELPEHGGTLGGLVGMIKLGIVTADWGKMNTVCFESR